MARDLCRVLDVKYDLGVRTRKAYLAGDKNELAVLAEKVYPEYIRRTEEFYETFKTLWMKENKPHGFDIQDLRFGGLIMRAKHCRQTLEDYIEGRLASIAELDEDVLPVSTSEGTTFREPWYHRTVSANLLSHGMNF